MSLKRNKLDLELVRKRRTTTAQCCVSSPLFPCQCRFLADGRCSLGRTRQQTPQKGQQTESQEGEVHHQQVIRCFTRPSQFRQYSNHGSGHGDAVDQAGGAEPGPGGEDPVQVEDGEGPEEQDLEPDEADEEEGLLGDEVVAHPAAVPAFEVEQGVREEGLREARLGVEQGHADGHQEEEEEEDGVDQLHESTHFHSEFVREGGGGGEGIRGERLKKGGWLVWLDLEFGERY